MFSEAGRPVTMHILAKLSGPRWMYIEFVVCYDGSAGRRSRSSRRGRRSADESSGGIDGSHGALDEIDVFYTRTNAIPPPLASEGAQ